ncbi:PREDICTED: serine/arginine-rich splicing factor RS31-like isoform X3 [Ipomoea nil]|nr:PREDICTED: serine/arginine-rich splicing factor RS31-like isoform X3 [Ipomoea nil]XP_019191798.1 PREDICTED: serine/arginine-rich splicing factor RS31-like isoform X3 [Ipomoea nil]
MRPVFCGNFEYDTRQSDLERLFRKYGKVDRVDMKSGFAFVYMEDERDGDDAIRGLDRLEFGRKGRRLRVEWSKEERGRRHESSRKSSGGGSTRLSKTLFVINFDPYHTRTRDLERHFEPYGKILNIRIRRNFAFIQYEMQEDATKALDATNLSKLMDRVITVEYAIKDDDERKSGYSPDRTRDRSPRRGYDRGRSRSPCGRERASPDYGRGRGRSPSPYRRERPSPVYGRSPSGSPNHKGRDSEHARGRSPNVRKERNSGNGSAHSLSPRQESPAPGNGRANGELEGGSPDYAREHSRSPHRERQEKSSPDGYRHGGSPNLKHEVMDGPEYGGESPPERYRSGSASSRERSRS